MRGVTSLPRLICFPLIALSILLTLQFDWKDHAVETLRTHQPVPGDFLVFRGAALLAMHSAAKVAASSAGLPYLPPFLLFVAPFAWLPPFAGFSLWVIVSVLALSLAARAIGCSWPAISLGLLAQPVIFCITRGQSGILVSAFVLLALGLVDVQPMVAGLAAGAIIAKPQLGLLVPFFYLGARKFRAGFTAAASLAGFCAAATLSFGWRIWVEYRTGPLHGAQSMLTAAWPAKFQFMMVTPMVMLRSLHVGLDAASIAQAMISSCAAVAGFWLWRQKFSALERLAPSLCLITLATPYSYIYDLPALGIALAALAFAGSARGLLALTLLFCFTSIYALISYYYFSTGALFLLGIMLLAWPRRAAAGSS